MQYKIANLNSRIDILSLLLVFINVQLLTARSELGTQWHRATQAIPALRQKSVSVTDTTICFLSVVRGHTYQKSQTIAVELNTGI